MQHDFIIWLYKWQTIIGSFIGGITGFIAAQWVASNARTRDEVVSAKILIMDMLSIKEKTRILDTSVANIEDQYKKLEFTLQYLRRKPILSPLFDSSMATVMPCNYELSVHLSSFRKIYLNVEESLIRIEKKVFIAEDSGEKIKLTSHINDDITTIYDGLHIASKQAECIVFYLEESVLSKLRYFKKFIMRVKNICRCQNDLEKKCRELISKGS